eukprot:scaffold1542_cov140-Isochrysis_galbana.AAC.2
MSANVRSAPPGLAHGRDDATRMTIASAEICCTVNAMPSSPRAPHATWPSPSPVASSRMRVVMALLTVLFLRLYERAAT